VRKIFSIALLVVGLGFLYGCSRENVNDTDFVRNLGEKVNQMTEYRVDAVMEIVKEEEGSVIYDLVIEFMNPDFYKITLRNRENNNLQVILKNETGVFVLTPALNKSFRFQSDWPNNSSHAYLLQSVHRDLINDSNSVITSDSRHFFAESRVNHKTNNRLVSQRAIFDRNTLLPREVTVFDSSREAALIVTFGVFNETPGLSRTDFDLERTNLTARLELGEGSANFTEREILMPGYVPAGVFLESQTTTETKSIKFFDGELSFTVVQEFRETSPILSTARLFGNPVMLYQTVGAATANSLTWFHNGIEYMIFSTILPLEEKIRIANSFIFGLET